MAEKTEAVDYSQWSRDGLIERITHLERQLKGRTTTLAAARSRPRVRSDRPFDPSKYSTRLIALKIAYLGKAYKGFAHAAEPDSTALPTVERELWRALRGARLIHPSPADKRKGKLEQEVNWEGCEYSMCGRTDRGVSAFGQVIGVRVRSNRPRTKDSQSSEDPERVAIDDKQEPKLEEMDTTPTDPRLETDYEDVSSFDPIADELPYPQILNRLLPHDIRVLAWCPAPSADFSTRFSCRERQYRYFFTQPAFASSLRKNGNSKTSEGWLDLQAMREAAKSFIGVHDFRNFCKIDPTKQITNFERRIVHADVIEMDPHAGHFGYTPVTDQSPANMPAAGGPPRVWAFIVHGSAFLWHQVRHMVAILFLIGQGLEPPSLVAELLDTQRHPCKPAYNMAAETPLVLWDCIFPHPDDPGRKNALEWVYHGQTGTKSSLASDSGDQGRLLQGLWSMWRGRKMDEILMGSLLEVLVGSGGKVQAADYGAGPRPVERTNISQLIFDGSDSARPAGKYVPVLKQPRREPVEEINQKYLARRGQSLSEAVQVEVDE